MTVLQTLHSMEKLRFVKGLPRFLELLRSSRKWPSKHPLDEIVKATTNYSPP